jgi:hypothetical protein
MTRGRGDPRKTKLSPRFNAAKDYPTEFEIVSTGVNSGSWGIYSESAAAMTVRTIIAMSGSPTLDAIGKSLQPTFVELLLNKLLL